MPTKTDNTMQQMAEKMPERLIPFTEGDVVEASVISVSKHKILVDVAGVALGMVPEREYSYDVDDLNTGDKVTGYVLLAENRDGYVILSLKRADKERVWVTLAEKQSSGEPVKVRVAAVNRGGIVVEFGGVEGFIPLSQLSNERVEKLQGEQQKSLQKNRDLIGTFLHVKVVTADKISNKLIFSEKTAPDGVPSDLLDKFTVGAKLKGVITGIVDFGIFVKVTVPGQKDEIEGLVHISEVSWDRIENLSSQFQIGQTVDIVVIGSKNGRVSFSIKRLVEDPWGNVTSKLKVGTKVEGEVTRVTPYGAFVKLENNLDGLVHISELGDNITDVTKVVTEGKKYTFTITSIKPESRKISLSLKDQIAPEKPTEKKESTKKSTSEAKSTKSTVKKTTAKKKTS